MTGRRGADVLCRALAPAMALSLVAGPAAAQPGGGEAVAPVAWTLAALLLICGVSFVSGLLLSGEGAAWWRGRALRRRVGATELPGAITGTDGRVGWINGPMRAEFGADAPRRGIAEILSSRLSVDESLVYRLARRAREIGFASHEVSGPAMTPRILTARYDDPGRLVWMLVPPDSLAVDGRSDDGADERAREAADGAPDTDLALDVVPVALMRVDLSGRVISANASAREVLRHDPSPGTPLAALLDPLGRPMEALIDDAANCPLGQREMVRLRGVEPDQFLQIALSPATLEGKPSLLALLTDASELRNLEDKFAQSQKMEAVGKLAGGVAHDFNNVLTAISGHSDLLLVGKDALHPDYSDLMQIRQNTHRAAALVRQLLAFSRKQTLNPVLLSVQDVVSDTRYLLDRLIGEKITLVMEHGRDLGQVRADHQQLEQALMNLVVNARDAMPEGGIITIATRNVAVGERQFNRGVDIRPGDYVEIGISDSGTGIDPQVIDRVFDPFFTTKPVGEGTGLGLATVYGIVKQSAGYIFAENRPEGGARFRILLPHARPARHDAAGTALDGSAVPAQAESGGQADLTGTGSILLVEDEDPVRAFATRALKLRGYEVIAAANAEEAMNRVADPETRIDLVISDVIMPGMDGPTFAAEARKRRPGMRVIFVSGYAEDSFRKNLTDHDFEFLPKPFSLTELTATVKAALEGPTGGADALNGSSTMVGEDRN